MNILTIGYDKTTLNEFAKNYKNHFSISVASNANMSWHDFHNVNFTIKTKSPVLTDLEIASLIENFEKFSDVNSRRYAIVHAHHSEVRNILFLQAYKAAELLAELEIDTIFFNNMPHEGFDLIFYQLAKLRSIRTLITNQTQFSNKFWIIEDINDYGIFSTPDIGTSTGVDFALPESWFYVPKKTVLSHYQWTECLADILKTPIKLPVYLLKYYYDRQFRKNHRPAITEYRQIDFPFLYYPLHLQPEMNVTALSDIDGIFADQLTIIERLSYLLPQDMKIVIKENPKQNYKYRDNFFYQRLASLSNVIVAADHLDSRELVGASRGVATLSGTVGWEAINLGKPCLTFGKAWFNQLSGVTKYSKDFDITEWMISLPVDTEQTVSEMKALIRKCGDGIVDNDYNGLVSSFDPEINARLVVESLNRFLEYTNDQ